jgi:hypothetical protein
MFLKPLFIRPILLRITQLYHATGSAGLIAFQNERGLLAKRNRLPSHLWKRWLYGGII